MALLGAALGRHCRESTEKAPGRESRRVRERRLPTREAGGTRFAVRGGHPAWICWRVVCAGRPASPACWLLASSHSSAAPARCSGPQRRSMIAQMAHARDPDRATW